VGTNHTKMDLGTCFFANPSFSGCVECGHILGVNSAMSLLVGNRLVRVESKDPVGLWGPVDDLRILHIVRPASGVAQSLSFRQISLALSQGAFRLFPIINLCCGSVPTHDGTLGTPVWVVKEQAPAILAVSSTKPGFRLERDAACDATPPGFPKPRLIVRMQVPGDIVVVQKLRQRHAPEIQ